tara:strand:+ start:10212 stop:10592 length:381 start_codon:yes stop_codon:yes gene_type:complete
MKIETTETAELTIEEKIAACPISPIDTDVIGEQFSPPSKANIIIMKDNKVPLDKNGRPLKEEPKMFSPYIRVFKKGKSVPESIKVGGLYLVSGGVQFVKLNNKEFVVASYPVLTCEVDESGVTSWW